MQEKCWTNGNSTYLSCKFPTSYSNREGKRSRARPLLVLVHCGWVLNRITHRERERSNYLSTYQKKTAGKGKKDVEP